MKKFLRKNLLLVIALLLPIALIVSVALGPYVFSLYLSTNYNFVYSLCETYPPDSWPPLEFSCSEYKNQVYYIENNKLYYDEEKLQSESKHYKIDFFLYNANNGKSKKLTEKELYSLRLIEGRTSPDGAYIVEKVKSKTFFWYQHYYSVYYLEKEGRSRKIVDDRGYVYKDQFEPVGWVLRDKVES